MSILFQLLYFSVLKVPFCSSIFYFLIETFYFFLLRLSFFICFKYVDNCSLKHFYDSCFKILSDNFNISVILVLTSINSFVTQLETFLIVGMASDFF